MNIFYSRKKIESVVEKTFDLQPAFSSTPTPSAAR
jgi:hypothetical protein